MKKSISVRLDEATQEKLQALALRSNRDVSSVIRDLIHTEADGEQLATTLNSVALTAELIHDRTTHAADEISHLAERIAVLEQQLNTVARTAIVAVDEAIFSRVLWYKTLEGKPEEVKNGILTEYHDAKEKARVKVAVGEG